MRSSTKDSAAALLLLLAACRGAEPAQPVVAAELAAVPRQSGNVDASSTLDAGHTFDASSTTRTTPPPPGMYAITMADRSNTCPPADGGAPPNAIQWVTFERGSDGRWTANLPVNTGYGSPGLDRNFVTLEVGTTSTSEHRPDRTCDWQVRRAMEVLSVTPTSIVVDIRAEYTDAVRCTLPRRPVNCARDAVVTYTLVRPFCAAGCTAKPSVLADGGVEATCACDGGL